MTSGHPLSARRRRAARTAAAALLVPLAAVGLAACSRTPSAPATPRTLPPVSGGAGSGASGGAGTAGDAASSARAQQSSAAAAARLGACPDTSRAPAGGATSSTASGTSSTAGGAARGSSVAAPLPTGPLPCLHPPGTATGPASVDLARLRGPAVVNVWASWCGPCRQEAPLLQALHERAGSRLTVLGVDYSDDDLDALAFAGRAGLTYPSVTATADQFPLARYNPGPPVTLFVDAAGQIVYVAHQPFPTQAALDAAVHDHLGVSVG